MGKVVGMLCDRSACGGRDGVLEIGRIGWNLVRFGFEITTSR